MNPDDHQFSLNPYDASFSLAGTICILCVGVYAVAFFSTLYYYIAYCLRLKARHPEVWSRLSWGSFGTDNNWSSLGLWMSIYSTDACADPTIARLKRRLRIAIGTTLSMLVACFALALAENLARFIGSHI